MGRELLGELGYALVVGDRDHQLTSALDGAIPTVRCPGSGTVSCPALHGGSCATRDAARVTIVFLSHDEEETQRASCVGTSDAPVVAVVEGLDLAPRIFDRFAIVGDAAGPVGILGAVAGLVEGSRR